MVDDAPEKIYNFPAIPLTMDEDLQRFFRELRASLVNQFQGIRYFETDVYIAGQTILGTEPNRIIISSTGDLLLEGTARVWKTHDLAPTAIKHPSADAPGSTEYENLYYDAYDNGSMEQIFYLWHIPTDFCASDASVRGHFGLMAATPPTDPDPTEVIAMGFEYMKLSAGDVNTWSADGGGALDINIVMDETAYTWHESEIGICVTTGWVVGDLIIFRFFRDIDAEYSANDDYDGGDALVGIYHLEFLSCILGEGA